MGWYGRSKFALISYRTTLITSSKIVSKTSTTAQVQHPISRIKPHHNSSGVSHLSPASKRVLLGDFQAKGYPYTPFLGNNISARGYHVGSQGVRHLKRRRWGFVRYLAYTYVVFVVVVVGAGITVAVRYRVSETIPYTKRKHFVLPWSKTDRRLSENDPDKLIKAACSLPPDHPESVRINKIAANILLSLQRGLGTDLSYTAGGTTTMGDRNVKHAEMLDDDDDKWIHGSSTSTHVGKKGKEKGSADQYAIEHLRGLNWEVYVVNEPSINAFCTQWGKITVSTGLIKFLKTDAELAYVVAHEVAHVVARHSDEKYAKNLWAFFVAMLHYPFLSKDSFKKAITYLYKFSGRMELEADYIGLLLMASAGYDPRVSQQVLERMSKLDDPDNVVLLKDYRDTHPSWKTRGKLVSEARVMQEALDIYREAMAGREVEGFFL